MERELAEKTAQEDRMKVMLKTFEKLTHPRNVARGGGPSLASLSQSIVAGVVSPLDDSVPSIADSSVCVCVCVFNHSGYISDEGIAGL